MDQEVCEQVEAELEAIERMVRAAGTADDRIKAVQRHIDKRIREARSGYLSALD